MSTEKTVTHNQDRKRFEYTIENKTAFIEYMINKQGMMYLTHTEVPKAFEGQGIGSQLAKTALSYIQENEYKLVPLCPFVANYLRRHPEWNPLLAPGFNV